MAADPITAGLDLANTLVSRIFPDKSQEEKDKLAMAMTMAQQQFAATQAQIDVDRYEASSSDPLQHWRGGLGWVCTVGYAWNFVLQPLINAVAVASGNKLNLPPLEIGQLSALTFGLLGLGGLHVAERIKGAA